VVLDEDGAELDEVLCASVSAQCCTFLWRRYVPEPLLDWGSMRSRTSHVLERSIISDVFSLLYAEEKSQRAIVTCIEATLVDNSRRRAVVSDHEV